MKPLLVVAAALVFAADVSAQCTSQIGYGASAATSISVYQTMLASGVAASHGFEALAELDENGDGLSTCTILNGPR